MSTIGYDLHTLVRHLDRHADRLLQEHGLTYRRYVTLLVIGELGDATQRGVAEQLDVSDAAVSRMVPVLAETGLVTVVADAGRGHRKRITLTSAGRQQLDAATATLGTALDELTRSLGIDPDALAADLRTIRSALGG